MQSAALSFSDGFRHAAKHAKPELSDTQRPVRSIHSVPSLPRQQHGVEDVDVTTGRVSRNISTLRTDVETRLVAAFTEAAPQYQVKAAALAPTIGASASTLEGYRQRFPQAAVNLVMIGRSLPMFGLELMDMMNIDIDQDRAAFAEFLSLQRRIRGQ